MQTVYKVMGNGQVLGKHEFLSLAAIHYDTLVNACQVQQLRLIQSNDYSSTWQNKNGFAAFINLAIETVQE